MTAIRTFVLLSLLLCLTDSFGYGQENEANAKEKVSSLGANEIERIKRSGTKEQFDVAWNSLVSEAQSPTAIKARVLQRNFPHNSWSRASVASYNETMDIACNSAFVIDVCSDFVDMRVRQDFSTLRIPKGREAPDLAAYFSVDKVPLFSTPKNELTTRHEMQCITLDHQISRTDEENAKISLPKPPLRVWPTVVDWRLVGWVSIEQWHQPTSLEQWMRILSIHTPFSLEKISEDNVRLTFAFENKRTLQKSVTQLDLNPKKKYRLGAVYEFDGLASTNPDQLRIVKSPKFQSRLYYEGDKLAAVVLSREHSEVHRFDFLSWTIDPEVEDHLFESSDFLRGGVGLNVSAEFQEFLLNKTKKE